METKNHTDPYYCYDAEAIQPNWKKYPIVAIAVAKHDSKGELLDRETWILKPETWTPIKTRDESIKKIKTPTPENETQAIIEFLDWMQPFEQTVYSYNSGSWDIPYLYSSLGHLQCKEHIPRHVVKVRKLERMTIDMMPAVARLLPKNQELPNTLEDAADALGITHDQYDDGDDVYQLFQENRLDKLEQYLLNDLEMTGELASRLRQQDLIHQ